MDSIAMPVTIVVKAPNQQIEDQTIHCELDWTIKRLKGYLSEVYPSKPRSEDQKLIYSGQLLVDTVQLKDVLRSYDGQENHTVHLVCSPPRDSYKSNSATKITNLNKASTSGISSNFTTTTSSLNINDSSSSNNSSNSSINMQNIRTHLNETEPLLETSREGVRRGDDPRELWAAATAAAAAAYPNIGAYSGSNVAHQMAWMQQAYSQYMNHYIQFLASSQGGADAARMAYPMYNGFRPAMPNSPGVHNMQPQADVQPPQPNAAANNQLQQQDDEEEGRGGNRDWLDWFYVMSRVLVLFSIIYFYSSPVRFLMVTTLGMFMYLYQVGFFRMQGLDAGGGEVALNNNGNVANLAAAERENNNDQPNPAVATTPASAGDSNSENNSAPQQEVELPPPAEPERPSFLTLTWTILCSFLLSLIPEQPNVI